MPGLGMPSHCQLVFALPCLFFLHTHTHTYTHTGSAYVAQDGRVVWLYRAHTELQAEAKPAPADTAVSDTEDVCAFLADCRKQCIMKEAALFKAEARCRELSDCLEALRQAAQDRDTFKV